MTGRRLQRRIAPFWCEGHGEPMFVRAGRQPGNTAYVPNHGRRCGNTKLRSAKWPADAHQQGSTPRERTDQKRCRTPCPTKCSDSKSPRTLRRAFPLISDEVRLTYNARLSTSSTALRLPMWHQQRQLPRRSKVQEAREHSRNNGVARGLDLAASRRRAGRLCRPLSQSSDH
jgi:hypothetical protein